MSMAGHHKTDEQTLIANAKRGDLEAFNALVLAYQDAIFSVTYRIMGDEMSAADSTQDTFVTAYRRLETYKGGNFRAWLFKIATNTCYDALRYQKRRPATPLDDLAGESYDEGPPIADSGISPEQAAQNNELHAAIQECINALNPDQRIVLVMCDVEGYSYQEIADNADIQIGTVKSRLSRARASVRQCLQAFEELLPAAYRLRSKD